MLSMLASFLLALREGLEAALVLGVILGALTKLNRTQFKPAVWLGAAIAVLTSLLAGVGLFRFGVSLQGDAEKIFEGSTMLLAAGVLTWMIFWMKRQSRGVRQGLEASVLAADHRTAFLSLTFLAFITIMREGVELALFIMAAAFSVDQSQALWGAAAGLTSAILLGWLLYTSSIQLNLRRFFNITSLLLLIFAAGLVAHGVHEFNELGWIPTVIDPIWNMNHILDESSPTGQMLKALFGYNGNPSLTEVLSYLGYMLLIVTGLRLVARSRPGRQLA
ncbi:MAG: iron permease [Clostridia bacterium]|nr:MAG: iron permease [Clostridia bacterium]